VPEDTAGTAHVYWIDKLTNSSLSHEANVIRTQLPDQLLKEAGVNLQGTVGLQGTGIG